MFERYTEKARRAIFYGRLESSKLGGPCIESEHLLLGLLAADKAIFARFLQPEAGEAEIREAIVRSTPVHTPVSTSVDLPLSNESKRILAYSAEEADRLGHEQIEVDHLLLGTLREESCFAARLLAERGLRLDHVRTVIASQEKPVGRMMAREGAPPGPRLAHVQFVEAGSQEPVLVHGMMHLVPREGDKLILRKEREIAALYRVQAIEWDFETGAGSSLMQNVMVRVVIERVSEG